MASREVRVAGGGREEELAPGYRNMSSVVVLSIVAFGPNILADYIMYKAPVSYSCLAA